MFSVLSMTAESAKLNVIDITSKEIFLRLEVTFVYT